MRLLVLLVVAAASHPAGFVSVGPTDQIRIAGSSTRCVVQEAAVFCARFRGGALQAGDYGTLAIAGGVAVLAFRSTDGVHTATVFRRWPGGLPSITAIYDPDEEPAHVVTLKVGQVARVRGTRLDCAVVRAGARNVPTVYCATDDKVGPIPKTYATLTSDDGIAVGKVGSSRRTTIVFTHRQP